MYSKPQSAFPNFNLEFLLFTDSCDYGIGAVLSQLPDGKEIVIAYASRQLQKAEIKYPTVENEALVFFFSSNSSVNTYLINYLPSSATTDRSNGFKTKKMSTDG